MQKWYNEINTNQRILLWVVSIPAIFLYGVGVLPTAVLLYLEFGRRS